MMMVATLLEWCSKSIENLTHDTFMFFLSPHCCLSKHSTCPKQGHPPTYIPGLLQYLTKRFFPGIRLSLPLPTRQQGTTKSLILSHLHLNIVLGRPRQETYKEPCPQLSCGWLPALAAVFVFVVAAACKCQCPCGNVENVHWYYLPGCDLNHSVIVNMGTRG